MVSSKTNPRLKVNEPMTPTKPKNPRLKLNPKFQAAHSDKNNNPWGDLESQLASATSGDGKIAYEIEQARKTGRLSLSGLSITSLPDAIFDIRNDLMEKYEGDIDEQNQLKSHEKSWQCYGEEMLTVVDLSENDLSNAKSLEKISCYKALSSLHIRNCKLPSLPWDVFQSDLTSLKVLNAPGNNFVKVPMHLLPESIMTLNLADNNIESLGDDVSLPNLTKLDLQNNKNLVRLPLKLCTPSLQHANFSKNNIEVVPKDFLMSCKGSLQTLDLSENQLTLPMNLIEHSELQILELGRNKIRSVPVIHENLIKLNLDKNDITSIEGLYPVLKQCNDFGKTEDGDWFRPKLKELFLSQNNLSELHSQSMAVMTKLSFIDVVNNSLETLPSVVGYLRDLNKVAIDGNPFRIIRSAISYRAEGGIDTEKLLRSLRKRDYPPKGPGYHPSAAYFEGSNGNDAATSQNVMEAKMLVRKATTGKRSLDINGRGLTGELKWSDLVDALLVEVDTGIVGNRVSTLNIANGKLTSFGTEWVNALPSLSVLDANRNCLESLPSNLCQLPLQSILCPRNCLLSKTLEDVICIHNSPLSSTLVELDLSMNKLQWIPDGLFDLNNLRKLNLAQNDIKSLAWKSDEETGEESGWRHGLISLEYLNLSENRIHDLGYLPLALFGCKNLQTLLLNNNCIYDIPLELGLLEQLTKIDLLGNSQRKIGIRVLTQSTSNILKFLRDRMDKAQLSKAHVSHAEIMEALEEEYNVGKSDVVEVQQKNSNDGDTRKATPHIMSQSAATESAKSPPDTTLQTKVSENSNHIMERINQLKEQIRETEAQLENLSISQSKRFALKKTMAMDISKLIREERKLNVK